MEPSVSQAPPNQTGDSAVAPERPRLSVEVVSEGPHCVPCEYAIAAVEYVAECFRDRIDVRVIETKRAEDAARYIELCRVHNRRLPFPSVLIAGRLAFEGIPDPEDLNAALDEALSGREKDG
jgi:hypothetical protein